MLGPLLGLTRPRWRERPSKVGQNILMHAVFGAVTGFVADRIERRTSGATRAAPKLVTEGSYLRYSDDVEAIGPDEGETFDRIIAVMAQGRPDHAGALRPRRPHLARQGARPARRASCG